MFDWRIFITTFVAFTAAVVALLMLLLQRGPQAPTVVRGKRVGTGPMFVPDPHQEQHDDRPNHMSVSVEELDHEDSLEEQESEDDRGE